jgi:hypothetical protein
MSLVLTLSVRYNSATTQLLKLYPLILFSIGAIIFTFVYLFRFISISYGEVKYIGRFTSRDSVMINEGKTLVIELLDKGRVSLRVYGNEGYNPEIKWLTAEANDTDICIFRGKAYGGESVAIRILCHFGVEASDITRYLSEDGFSATYENVSVTSLTEDSHKQIRIHFDKTV